MFHACSGVSETVHHPHHCSPSPAHGHTSHCCHLLPSQDEEYDDEQDHSHTNHCSLAAASPHNILIILISPISTVQIIIMFRLLSPAITPVQSSLHISNIPPCSNHHPHLRLLLLHTIQETQVKVNHLNSKIFSWNHFQLPHCHSLNNSETEHQSCRYRVSP